MFGLGLFFWRRASSGTTTGSGSLFLLENSTDFLMLEDGSSFLLLE